MRKYFFCEVFGQGFLSLIVNSNLGQSFQYLWMTISDIKALVSRENIFDQTLNIPPAGTSSSSLSLSRFLLAEEKSGLSLLRAPRPAVA